MQSEIHALYAVIELYKFSGLFFFYLHDRVSFLFPLLLSFIRLSISSILFLSDAIKHSVLLLSQL